IAGQETETRAKSKAIRAQIDALTPDVEKAISAAIDSSKKVQSNSLKGFKIEAKGRDYTDKNYNTTSRPVIEMTYFPNIPYGDNYSAQAKLRELFGFDGSKLTFDPSKPKSYISEPFNSRSDKGTPLSSKISEFVPSSCLSLTGDSFLKDAP